MGGILELGKQFELSKERFINKEISELEFRKDSRNYIDIVNKRNKRLRFYGVQLKDDLDIDIILSELKS